MCLHMLTHPFSTKSIFSVVYSTDNGVPTNNKSFLQKKQNWVFNTWWNWWASTVQFQRTNCSLFWTRKQWKIRERKTMKKSVKMEWDKSLPIISTQPHWFTENNRQLPMANTRDCLPPALHSWAPGHSRDTWCWQTFRSQCQRQSRTRSRQSHLQKKAMNATECCFAVQLASYLCQPISRRFDPPKCSNCRAQCWQTDPRAQTPVCPGGSQCAQRAVHYLERLQQIRLQCVAHQCRQRTDASNVVGSDGIALLVQPNHHALQSIAKPLENTTCQ